MCDRIGQSAQRGDVPVRVDRVVVARCGRVRVVLARGKGGTLLEGGGRGDVAPVLEVGGGVEGGA
jgi:hypothetical protein